MHVTTRLHWLPKAGNRRTEYEDAAWPVRALQATGSEFRCAVADGATESAFAGLWARQLVHWYSHHPVHAHEPLQEQLADEQRRWYSEVRRTPLPWYAEEKALSGAYAALLGLRLSVASAAGGHWQIVSVGDCCAVHLRGEALLTSFPASNASFFGSRPYLISSLAQRNADLEQQTHSSAGAWEPGDRFLLMTDALAHWLLTQESAQGGAASLLATRAAGARRPFAGWIAALRRAGELRNDDVTLLAVTVDA